MSDVFRILDEGTALPFRPGSQFPDYWLFMVSDQEAQLPNYRVLVSPQASAEAIAAAARNRPREIGGVVVGRFLRDAEGPYTLATNVIIAPDGSGDFGQLRLSPELTTRLKEEAGRVYPTADVVGWWHSHMSVSNYSTTDLASQRIWTNPRHIGLLVFADADRRSPDDSPWARVYVGPEAQPAFAYRQKVASAVVGWPSPNDVASAERGHIQAVTQNALNRLALPAPVDRNRRPTGG